MQTQTYVRESTNGKWHILNARQHHKAVLPGEYVRTTCQPQGRSIKARNITQYRNETNDMGICYRCTAKERKEGG